jgi:hypothetical protein
LVLGKQRVVGPGRQALGFHQPSDALDDDPRLASPRARDHDERPVAPFDDPLLGRGQAGC